MQNKINDKLFKYLWKDNLNKTNLNRLIYYLKKEKVNQALIKETNTIKYLPKNKPK